MDRSDLPEALQGAAEALETARRAREDAEAELTRSQQAQARADKAIEDSRRLTGGR